MSEETCPDCGRVYGEDRYHCRSSLNDVGLTDCLRHAAARQRTGNEQTSLLLMLERSYTSTIEGKLSAATARVSELERELEGCVTVDTALASQDELAALVAQRDAELSALGERVARAERENEAWRALVHWTHRGIDRGLDAYDDDVLIVAADKVVFIGKSALECAENIPAVKQKLGLLQPETSARRST